MARNRMIKPEFWSSETLMRVSRDSRLTFIGIWNFCDDYGFCLNSGRSLIGDIYPYDDSVTEAKLKGWIGELIECKLLIPVEYESKKLLFVKGWGEHQTVQHKSKRSFIKPIDLEQVIKDSLKSHEDLIAVYLESHAPKRKKKEKEESNKEKEESNKDHLDIFDIFRKVYPGTKNGNEVEFENFQAKNANWKEILPDLKGLLDCIINQRDLLKSSGGFVAQWKNLSTWINQKCWTEEVGRVDQVQTTIGKGDSWT